MEKKYYWFKMQNDFFRRKEIKKLRSIAGGDTYTVIYLKMLLQSLENNGKLYFEGIENTFEEELALELDESADNVGITVKFLLSMGLLAAGEDENTFELEQVHNLVGSETAAAERKRRQREREKQLLLCDNVTGVSRVGHVEIEKDIDIDIDIEKEEKSADKPRTTRTKKEKPVKHKHGDYNNVLLSDEELDKLKIEFPTDYETRIQRLDDYLEQSGKHYKSHLATIRNWARRDQENGRSNNRPKGQNSGGYVSGNLPF
ncbi:replisome organizer [Butyrivibrio virus Bo-Finn]|nr:replisome organizer [Butyrivibrio virus Bo-Finn]